MPVPQKISVRLAQIIVHRIPTMTTMISASTAQLEADIGFPTPIQIMNGHNFDKARITMFDNKHRHR
ncbi:hypothetical protein ACJMK2_042947 [Sinanodonta woodiana]|uniref:Uncharacterized protein n=1 Tax=Sinanodonta woodiana TaxID=1069815 RepID=A0ABD3VVF4_SINWO